MKDRDSVVLLMLASHLRFLSQVVILTEDMNWMIEWFGFAQYMDDPLCHGNKNTYEYVVEFVLCHQSRRVPHHYCVWVFHSLWVPDCWCGDDFHFVA